MIEGAAEREVSAARNLDAFGSATWHHAPGVQVGQVDTAVELFGRRLRAPLLTAPCGLVGAVHPDAEPGVFGAAAGAGVGAVLSTTATRALEVVAERSGHPDPWFQLYFLGGSAGAEQLVARAAAAGFRTLVLTLDTAVPGLRRRDGRHGLALPMQWSLPTMARLAPQLLRRPGWCAQVARDPSALGVGNGVHGLADGGLGSMFDQVPTWDDLTWLRRMWPGRIVVKGITHAADAQRAIDHGVDAIIVSNHGGRQLDGVPSTLHCLAEVRAVVAGRVPVLVDGGVRSGADIARAVALGADAVLVGRPYLYGMAVAGRHGAARVLELLCDELERTMRLLGVADLESLAQVPITLDPAPAAARPGVGVSQGSAA